MLYGCATEIQPKAVSMGVYWVKTHPFLPIQIIEFGKFGPKSLKHMILAHKTPLGFFPRTVAPKDPSSGYWDIFQHSNGGGKTEDQRAGLWCGSTTCGGMLHLEPPRP